MPLITNRVVVSKAKNDQYHFKKGNPSQYFETFCVIFITEIKTVQINFA
jgi:hypothetical protein